MRRRIADRFRGSLPVAALLLSAWPAMSIAQSGGYHRRSANGRDFPTWEREVDTSIPPPMPTAREGRHVLERSIELAGPPTGVVRLGDGALVAALRDGTVQVVDLEGEILETIDLGEEILHAPFVFRDTALVTAGSLLVAVASSGELWRASLPAPPSFRPVLRPAGHALTLADGSALLLDPETGVRLWSAEPEAGLTCGPAQSGDLLVWGTDDGRLLARRASDGAPAWTEQVAERVTSLTADADAVYFVGVGPTERAKRSSGPFLGRLSMTGKARRLAWRSRVGGLSEVEPILLADLVLFPCHDGYIHALERQDGLLAWRTDLPARLTARPQLVGGRLDVILPRTGWVVAIAADNGAVMGWTELPDEDETFVGPPTHASGDTVAATSFGRLVGLRWEYEPDP